MERLEDVEHRPVVIVEKAARDVHAEIWRDAHEILVERSMVNRAQAQPVAHDWFAGLLRITDDVRGVE